MTVGTAVMAQDLVGYILVFLTLLRKGRSSVDDPPILAGGGGQVNCTFICLLIDLQVHEIYCVVLYLNLPCIKSFM